MAQPTAVRRDIGPLSVIEFEAEASAPAIVFFHGYGADAADLAPLAIDLNLQRPARWIFPDGPLRLPFGGRAWFPIDVDSIERAQREGKPIDWSGREPQGLETARKVARELLQAVDAPWEKLVLGGFSQGSMLALDCALRAPRNPMGVVILSGNLVNEAEWKALAASRSGLPFFQSHGLVDPILGHAGARKLETLLVGAGLKGRLRNFEGGHAIPPDVLASLSDFLEAL